MKTNKLGKILVVALFVMLFVLVLTVSVNAATNHTVTTEAELTTALGSAADGDTITVSEAITLPANADITIPAGVELKGSADRLLLVDGTTATVTVNGKVTASKDFVRLWSGGNLTLKANNGSEFVLGGRLVDAENEAVATVLNVQLEGSKITSTLSHNNQGLVHFEKKHADSAVTWTISNTEISAPKVALFCTGSLNSADKAVCTITNSTITCYDVINSNSGGNGTVNIGTGANVTATLAIFSTGGAYKEIAVNVNGGALTAPNLCSNVGKVEYSMAGATVLNVSGGSVTVDNAACVNKFSASITGGALTISGATMTAGDVAKNETTGQTYATLKAAIESANDNDIITILNGVVISETINITKNITVTSSSAVAVLGGVTTKTNNTYNTFNIATGVNVTFGGNVTYIGCGFHVTAGATDTVVTFKDNVVVQNNTHSHVVLDNGTSGNVTVNIQNNVFLSGNYGIAFEGTATGNKVVNMTGGTVVANHSFVFNAKGVTPTVTLTDATLDVKSSAFWFYHRTKSATVTVGGNTVITSANEILRQSNNGSTAAADVGVVNFTLNGGVLKSAGDMFYQTNIGGKDGATHIKVDIYGGTLELTATGSKSVFMSGDWQGAIIVNMYGGTIKATNNTASNTVTAFNNGATGMKVNLYGGTVEGFDYVVHGNRGQTYVTVKNGADGKAEAGPKITSDCIFYAYAGYTGDTNNYGTNVTIEGGTFEATKIFHIYSVQNQNTVTVLVKGGTFKSTGDFLYAGNKASKTCSVTVNVEGDNTSIKCNAAIFSVCETAVATINVKNGSLETSNLLLYTGASAATCTLNISGGTIVSTKNDKNGGLCWLAKTHTNKIYINISGGSVTTLNQPLVGIWGSLDLNGENGTTVDDNDNVDANGNPKWATPHAVTTISGGYINTHSLINENEGWGTHTTTISGGTIELIGNVFYDNGGGAAKGRMDVTMTGGTMTAAGIWDGIPHSNVAQTFTLSGGVYNGATYVKSADAQNNLVKIGNTYYADLQAAINEADDTNGPVTIELIGTQTLACDKFITINKNVIITDGLDVNDDQDATNDVSLLFYHQQDSANTVKLNGAFNTFQIADGKSVTFTGNVTYIYCGVHPMATANTVTVTFAGNVRFDNVNDGYVLAGTGATGGKIAVNVLENAYLRANHVIHSQSTAVTFEVNVSGGTIESTSSSCIYINSAVYAKITVSGGNFTGVSNAFRPVSTHCDIEVTGGTFDIGGHLLHGSDFTGTVTVTGETQVTSCNYAFCIEAAKAGVTSALTDTVTVKKDLANTMQDTPDVVVTVSGNAQITSQNNMFHINGNLHVKVDIVGAVQMTCQGDRFFYMRNASNDNNTDAVNEWTVINVGADAQKNTPTLKFVKDFLRFDTVGGNYSYYNLNVSAGTIESTAKDGAYAFVSAGDANGRMIVTVTGGTFRRAEGVSSTGTLCFITYTSNPVLFADISNATIQDIASVWTDNGLNVTATLRFGGSVSVSGTQTDDLPGLFYVKGSSTLNLTIDGGTFTATTHRGIYSAKGNCNVTINNATITSKMEVFKSETDANSSTLIIKKGTFTAQNERVFYTNAATNVVTLGYEGMDNDELIAKTNRVDGSNQVLAQHKGSGTYTLTVWGGTYTSTKPSGVVDINGGVTGSITVYGGYFEAVTSGAIFDLSNDGFKKIDITVNGGTFKAAGNFIVSCDNTGTLTMTGGEVNCNHAFVVQGAKPDSTKFTDKVAVNKGFIKQADGSFKWETVMEAPDVIVVISGNSKITARGTILHVTNGTNVKADIIGGVTLTNTGSDLMFWCGNHSANIGAWVVVNIGNETVTTPEGTQELSPKLFFENTRMVGMGDVGDQTNCAIPEGKKSTFDCPGCDLCNAASSNYTYFNFNITGGTFTNTCASGAKKFFYNYDINGMMNVDISGGEFKWERTDGTAKSGVMRGFRNNGVMNLNLSGGSFTDDLGILVWSGSADAVTKVSVSGTFEATSSVDNKDYGMFLNQSSTKPFDVYISGGTLITTNSPIYTTNTSNGSVTVTGGTLTETGGSSNHGMFHARVAGVIVTVNISGSNTTLNYADGAAFGGAGSVHATVSGGTINANCLVNLNGGSANHQVTIKGTADVNLTSSVFIDAPDSNTSRTSVTLEGGTLDASRLYPKNMNGTATVTIKGGLYNGARFVVNENVAAIGTKTYSTLQEAINDADDTNGAVTITLIGGATIDTTVEINKNVVITGSTDDANVPLLVHGRVNDVLTNGGVLKTFHIAAGKTVTFAGNVRYISCGFYVDGGAANDVTTLTFAGDVEINNKECSAAGTYSYAFQALGATAGKLILNVQENAHLIANHCLYLASAINYEINITGGTIESTQSSSIYQTAGTCKVKVDGGAFKGVSNCFKAVNGGTVMNIDMANANVDVSGWIAEYSHTESNIGGGEGTLTLRDGNVVSCGGIMSMTDKGGTHNNYTNTLNLLGGSYTLNGQSGIRISTIDGDFTYLKINISGGEVVMTKAVETDWRGVRFIEAYDGNSRTTVEMTGGSVKYQPADPATATAIANFFVAESADDYIYVKGGTIEGFANAFWSARGKLTVTIGAEGATTFPTIKVTNAIFYAVGKNYEKNDSTVTVTVWGGTYEVTDGYIFYVANDIDTNTQNTELVANLYFTIHAGTYTAKGLVYQITDTKTNNVGSASTPSLIKNGTFNMTEHVFFDKGGELHVTVENGDFNYGEAFVRAENFQDSAGNWRSFTHRFTLKAGSFDGKYLLYHFGGTAGSSDKPWKVGAVTVNATENAFYLRDNNVYVEVAAGTKTFTSAKSMFNAVNPMDNLEITVKSGTFKVLRPEGSTDSADNYRMFSLRSENVDKRTLKLTVEGGTFESTGDFLWTAFWKTRTISVKNVSSITSHEGRGIFIEKGKDGKVSVPTASITIENVTLFKTKLDCIYTDAISTDITVKNTEVDAGAYFINYRNYGSGVIKVADCTVTAKKYIIGVALYGGSLYAVSDSVKAYMGDKTVKVTDTVSGTPDVVLEISGKTTFNVYERGISLTDRGNHWVRILGDEVTFEGKAASSLLFYRSDGQSKADTDINWSRIEIEGGTFSATCANLSLFYVANVSKGCTYLSVDIADGDFDLYNVYNNKHGGIFYMNDPQGYLYANITGGDFSTIENAQGESLKGLAGFFLGDHCGADITLDGATFNTNLEVLRGGWRNYTLNLNIISGSYTSHGQRAFFCSEKTVNLVLGDKDHINVNNKLTVRTVASGMQIFADHQNGSAFNATVYGGTFISDKSAFIDINGNVAINVVIKGCDVRVASTGIDFDGNAEAKGTVGEDVTVNKNATLNAEGNLSYTTVTEKANAILSVSGGTFNCSGRFLSMTAAYKVKVTISGNTVISSAGDFAFYRNNASSFDKQWSQLIIEGTPTITYSGTRAMFHMSGVNNTESYFDIRIKSGTFIIADNTEHAMPYFFENGDAQGIMNVDVIGGTFKWEKAGETQKVDARGFRNDAVYLNVSLKDCTFQGVGMLVNADRDDGASSTTNVLIEGNVSITAKLVNWTQNSETKEWSDSGSNVAMIASSNGKATVNVFIKADAEGDAPVLNCTNGSLFGSNGTVNATIKGGTLTGKWIANANGTANKITVNIYEGATVTATEALHTDGTAGGAKEKCNTINIYGGIISAPKFYTGMPMNSYCYVYILGTCTYNGEVITPSADAKFKDINGVEYDSLAKAVAGAIATNAVNEKGELVITIVSTDGGLIMLGETVYLNGSYNVVVTGGAENARLNAVVNSGHGVARVEGGAKITFTGYVTYANGVVIAGADSEVTFAGNVIFDTNAKYHNYRNNGAGNATVTLTENAALYGLHAFLFEGTGAAEDVKQLNITGGTVLANSHAIKFVVTNAKCNIAFSAGSVIGSGNYGMDICGENAVYDIQISGTAYLKGTHAIRLYGKNATHNVTFSGGTVESNKSSAIYQSAGTGTLTITGTALLTTETSSAIKVTNGSSMTINLTGGIFKARWRVIEIGDYTDTNKTPGTASITIDGITVLNCCSLVYSVHPDSSTTKLHVKNVVVKGGSLGTEGVDLFYFNASEHSGDILLSNIQVEVTISRFLVVTNGASLGSTNKPATVENCTVTCTGVVYISNWNAGAVVLHVKSGSYTSTATTEARPFTSRGSNDTIIIGDANSIGKNEELVITSKGSMQVFAAHCELHNGSLAQYRGVYNLTIYNGTFSTTNNNVIDLNPGLSGSITIHGGIFATTGTGDNRDIINIEGSTAKDTDTGEDIGHNAIDVTVLGGTFDTKHIFLYANYTVGTFIIKNATFAEGCGSATAGDSLILIKNSTLEKLEIKDLSYTCATSRFVTFNTTDITESSIENVTVNGGYFFMRFDGLCDADITMKNVTATSELSQLIAVYGGSYVRFDVTGGTLKTGSNKNVFETYYGTETGSYTDITMNGTTIGSTVEGGATGGDAIHYNVASGVVKLTNVKFIGVYRAIRVQSPCTVYAPSVLELLGDAADKPYVVITIDGDETNIQANSDLMLLESKTQVTITDGTYHGNGNFALVKSNSVVEINGGTIKSTGALFAVDEADTYLTIDVNGGTLVAPVIVKTTNGGAVAVKGLENADGDVVPCVNYVYYKLADGTTVYSDLAGVANNAPADTTAYVVGNVTVTTTGKLERNLTIAGDGKVTGSVVFIEIVGNATLTFDGNVTYESTTNIVKIPADQANTVTVNFTKGIFRVSGTGEAGAVFDDKSPDGITTVNIAEGADIRVGGWGVAFETGRSTDGNGVKTVVMTGGYLSGSHGLTFGAGGVDINLTVSGGTIEVTSDAFYLHNKYFKVEDDKETEEDETKENTLTVTVTGGTFIANTYGFNMPAGGNPHGSITIGGNAVFQTGSKCIYSGGGGTNVTITIQNGTFTGTRIIDLDYDSHSNITIMQGTFKATDDHVIYIGWGYSKIDIQGGTFTGKRLAHFTNVPKHTDTYEVEVIENGQTVKRKFHQILTISGGTFTSTNRMFSPVDNSSSYIKITGGTFTASGEAMFYRSDSTGTHQDYKDQPGAGDGTTYLYITGGTFTTKSCFMFRNTSATLYAVIEGGTFASGTHALIKDGVANYPYCKSTFDITGGTFTGLNLVDVDSSAANVLINVSGTANITVSGCVLYDGGTGSAMTLNMSGGQISGQRLFYRSGMYTACDVNATGGVLILREMFYNVSELRDTFVVKNQKTGAMYTSLEEAVAAANDGDTLEWLCSALIYETIELGGKSITITGGTKQNPVVIMGLLESNGCGEQGAYNTFELLDGGKLTLTGYVVYMECGVVAEGNNSEITFAGNVKFDNGELGSVMHSVSKNAGHTIKVNMMDNAYLTAYYGLQINTTDATVIAVINGGTIHTVNYSVYFASNAHENPSKLFIYGGTFISDIGHANIHVNGTCADGVNNPEATAPKGYIYGGYFLAGNNCCARSEKGGYLYVYGGYFKFVADPTHSGGPIRSGTGSTVGNVYVYGGNFETGSVGAAVNCMNSVSNAYVNAVGVNANGGSHLLNSSNSSVDKIFYPDGMAHYDGAISMTDGAGVRIAADGSNGLRFVSIVTKETLDYLASIGATNVKYGTLISPVDIVEQARSFTMADMDAAGLKYLDIKAEDGLVPRAAGGYYIRAALVDIQEGNYGREFAAVGYITYTIKDVNGKDVTMTIYTSYRETKNARSIEQVARMALEKSDLYTDSQVAVLQQYAPKTEAPVIDFYLIAGQSNAAGSSQFSDKIASLKPSYTQGYSNIFYCGSSNCARRMNVPMKIGYGSQIDSFGIELGMADALSQYYNEETGKYAAIIKYAYGGTRLYDNITGSDAVEGNWQPPSWIERIGCKDAQLSGGLFRAFVNHIESCVSDYEAMGYQVNIKSVYWMQGESDVGAHAKDGLYDDIFKLWIKDLRDSVCNIMGDDSYQSLPIIVGEISEYFGNSIKDAVYHQQCKDFVKMQREVIGSWENVYVMPQGNVPTVDWPSDDSHWGYHEHLWNGYIGGSKMLELAHGFYTSVSAEDAVAEIWLDGQLIGTYNSLGGALCMAPEGSVVKLLKDIEMYSTLAIGNRNKITLDGCGHKIDFMPKQSSEGNYAAIKFYATDITVQDLHVVNHSYTEWKDGEETNVATYGAVLGFEAKVTWIGGYLEAERHGFVLNNAGCELTIVSGGFKLRDTAIDYAGIIFNGAANVNVTIEGGNFDCGTGTAYAIYANASASGSKFVVNGGNFTKGEDASHVIKSESTTCTVTVAKEANLNGGTVDNKGITEIYK